MVGEEGGNCLRAHMIVGFVTKIVSRISQGNKIKIHVSSPKRFKRKEGAKTKKKIGLVLACSHYMKTPPSLSLCV